MEISLIYYPLEMEQDGEKQKTKLKHHLLSYLLPKLNFTLHFQLSSPQSWGNYSCSQYITVPLCHS